MEASMTTKIGNILVNYIQYGEGSDVVLLHGWGQNIEMMLPLGNELKEKRVTILDLPGFGKSEEPDTVWEISDYANFLKEFLEKLNIKKPSIIGHSFGGRIAIFYASHYETEKVVLFGAPCVREKVELTAKEKFLKKVKKLPGMNKIGEIAKNYIGSPDYKKASPRMRDILVKVVNQDLSDCAKKIKVPVLMIWGEKDLEAPVEDAKKLENLLEDGALIVLEGYTHYAYLEALPKVSAILSNFL